MSEELPRPLLNLPWSCHMSIDWRHSSQRKRTYLRTSLCEESPIRTKSRKAPKGSQLLELRSHIHSHTPPLWVARTPPPRNQSHPLRQLHRLDHQTNKKINLLSLHRGESRLAPPPIPRSFCDDILTVLANLPDEWPLVKIDLILSKAETYYVSWRRFLYLNERLRTLDADPAARTINRNKDRILEHLVQVLSEWIVASIEPAKELTRTKEPEFMFLHTKDFWFRSIWIDLHQALTIDRESSRDRAPIGLVRCICKDDHIKGKHAHVKFKLSNIHAFVPIWMAPVMLRNFRLIAAQSSPLSPLGQLDYREGWFAIVPKEGEPGETLCWNSSTSHRQVFSWIPQSWLAGNRALGWKRTSEAGRMESTAHQPVSHS